MNQQITKYRVQVVNQDREFFCSSENNLLVGMERDNTECIDVGCRGGGCCRGGSGCDCCGGGCSCWRREVTWLPDPLPRRVRRGGITTVGKNSGGLFGSFRWSLDSLGCSERGLDSDQCIIIAPLAELRS